MVFFVVPAQGTYMLSCSNEELLEIIEGSYTNENVDEKNGTIHVLLRRSDQY